jgi:glycerol-3-phosphate acyltransferase PlsY
MNTRIILLLTLTPPLLISYLIGIWLWMDLTLLLTQFLIVLPLCYILGSVPWGYLITRASSGVDIRQMGSKSIGSTNVLRTSGPKLAIIVFLLDIGKGLLAVLLAKATSSEISLTVTAGLLVIIGHNWPVFTGFKGGRGVAPGAACALIMVPWAFAFGITIFAILVYLYRYVSLGSLVGITAIFIFLLIQVLITNTSPVYLIFVGVADLMIFWQHRGNLRRLVAGTELRLGQKSES